MPRKSKKKQKPAAGPKTDQVVVRSVPALAIADESSPVETGTDLLASHDSVRGFSNGSFKERITGAPRASSD